MVLIVVSVVVLSVSTPLESVVIVETEISVTTRDTDVLTATERISD